MRSAVRGLSLFVAGLVAGCQVVAPSAPPSGTASPAPGQTGPAALQTPAGTPVLGLDWGRAASVERPVNYEETVSPTYGGTHPILRIAGQAMMVDLAALADGRGFVAVGYVPPDWTPTAWTSTDGSTWRLQPIGDDPFTFPVAVAVGSDGTIVAVGRSRNDPVAWTSTDGVAWVRHAVPASGAAPERVTSVAATSDGFVAGGSAGPELFEREARFWTSTDGRTWSAVELQAAVAADAEIRSIAASGSGLVAVGVLGTAQAWTGAAAWRSDDHGRSWTRVGDPSFDRGVAVSVVGAPSGGVVAVGSDTERREALAWTSADGRSWTRAPNEPSRIYQGGYVWMTDVAAVGDELVAIGEFQGLQRGIGMSWVSSDGRSWQVSGQAPVQQQAEFYAIAPGGPGAVVVGSFGAPDSYVPNVWLTPAR